MKGLEAAAAAVTRDVVVAVAAAVDVVAATDVAVDAFAVESNLDN